MGANVLKVDPLSAIRNKFITQDEKLETVIAKVRVFVSNISSPPLKRRYKRYGFSYFFVMHVGGLHVSRAQKRMGGETPARLLSDV